MCTSCTISIIIIITDGRYVFELLIYVADNNVTPCTVHLLTLRVHLLADAVVTVTLMNHVLPADDKECDTPSDNASDSGRLTATEMNSIKQRAL